MDALEAWVTLAEARYLTASSSIRAGSYGTYGLATHTAMRAAVQLADWRLLFELVEASRLQSKTRLLGSRAELDRALQGEVVPEEEESPRRSGLRRISLDDFSAPYDLIADDIFGSRVGLEPPWDMGAVME